MFKGTYKGKNADKLNRKFLILGESHYDKNGDDNFTTASVMENFRNHPCEKKYLFFRKIAESCGCPFTDVATCFEEFWDKVYFGNYVEDLCGIGNNKAKELIKSNRQRYNDNLFRFINDNEIDCVLIFGRLVFDSLPSLTTDNGKEEKCQNIDDGTIYVNKKKDWIAHCKFFADSEHKNTSIILQRDIDVYSMRHPSCRSGFRSENYSKFLKEIL